VIRIQYLSEEAFFVRHRSWRNPRHCRRGFVQVWSLTRHSWLSGQ
jgi:hypothetical protein